MKAWRSSAGKLFQLQLQLGRRAAAGVSASSSAGNGLPMASSPMLTRTNSGLSVRSWKLRIAFSSSSLRPRVAAGWPAPERPRRAPAGPARSGRFLSAWPAAAF